MGNLLRFFRPSVRPQPLAGIFAASVVYGATPHARSDWYPFTGVERARSRTEKIYNYYYSSGGGARVVRVRTVSTIFLVIILLILL